MKKLLALSLVFACILSLTGCGGVSESDYAALVSERDELLLQNEALKTDYETVCLERDALLTEGSQFIQVTISGSFVAKVRSVMPDYVLDGSTPQVAIVTSFQSGPFAVYLGKDLASQVEADGIYRFEIREENIEITQYQYDFEGIFPSDAIPLYNLRIASVNPAQPDEYGLNCNQLQYQLIE